MLELLDYLRANGFKTFIVSGGGIEFMRPWTEAVYGIPPEQVVGSSIKTAYEVRDGVPVIIRLPEINFIDDKAGKPRGDQLATSAAGRSPPSATPTATSRCSSGPPPATAPGSAIYIHHTDADREWAYDRDSHIGRLDRGLDEAGERGWVVVDMKRDWASIHPAD